MARAVARAVNVLVLLAVCAAMVVADASPTVGADAGTDVGPADVYILFDMEPGEGFNFRKKCLHRMLSFMRRFADDHTDTRFGMVVPTFRNRRGVEEYPLGTFFDLDAFQGALPNRNARILEVAEFVQEMGAVYDTLGLQWDKDGERRIDRDIFFTPEWQNFDPRECPNEEEAYTCGFYYHSPPSSDWTRHKEHTGWQVRLGGVTFNDAVLNCRNGGACMADEERLRKLVWSEVVAARASNAVRDVAGVTAETPVAIFLSGFDRISPAYEDGKARFWDERRHLHYAKPIQEAAQTFIQSKMSADAADFAGNGGPGTGFVSLHWRRKDFESHHAATYTTAEEVAATLLKYCNEQSVYTVFLASDGSEEEVAALRRALGSAVSADCTKRQANGENRSCPAAELITYDHSFKPEFNPMQSALVEQLIASKGRVFLGTHHSTFSLEVHFERATSLAETAWGGGKVGVAAWEGRDGSLTKAGAVIPLCDPDQPAQGEDACEPWW